MALACQSLATVNNLSAYMRPVMRHRQLWLERPGVMAIVGESLDCAEEHPNFVRIAFIALSCPNEHI